MKQVTIDRAKWATTFAIGGSAVVVKSSHAPSMLLNGCGDQCCLGFAVEQVCEISHDKLRHTMPQHVVGLTDPLFVVAGINNKSPSNFSRRAALINDLHGGEWQGPGGLYRPIDPPTKEQMLIEFFAENGITLTFEGEYPAHILEAFPQCYPS